MSQVRARTQPLLTIVLKSLVLLQKIVFYPYDEAELIQWIKPSLQKFVTAADIDRQILIVGDADGILHVSLDFSILLVLCPSYQTCNESQVMPSLVFADLFSKSA